jgi:ribosomal protein S18 acetylase RimI-like enzyme
MPHAMNDISTVRLRELDREALVAHFTSLDGEDRRLRFGSGISDEGLRAYVKRIDFGSDGVFAVQDDALRPLAVVHVAPGPGPAEMGLSVLPHARNQGLGNALFRRAVVFLRNRGARSVFMHCLSENAAIMHLARKHRMRVVRSGMESDARLGLEPATAESFIHEWLDDQRGRTVQALRQNGRLAQAYFGMLAPQR